MLSQKADFEIILVDDCSADSSGQICDEYAARDNRITVIHKEKNGFVGAARNDGHMKARGEYIYFLDSDDILCEGTLERVEPLLKEKFDVVCSSVRLSDFKDTLTGDINSVEDLFIFSPYLGQSFYKKSIITFPFHTERKTAEDCEWLYFNLQNAKSIISLPFPFYSYTSKREGSITTAFDRRYIAPTVNTWIRLYEATNNPDCEPHASYNNPFLSSDGWRWQDEEPQRFKNKERIKKYCADALIEHAIYANLAKDKELVKKCVPYLKKSKAKIFMPFRFLIGTGGVLSLINLKMKRKLKN